MSPQQSTARAAADLELIQDGVKLVSLVFGINLYTDASFYERAPQVLATYDAFLERCPPQRLTFYATETMKVHKPVNKRVLAMLPTWLEPAAPRKDYIALELKATKAAQDAPELKYEVWDNDTSDQANVISMALPFAGALEQPQEMLAFVKRLADTFEFRSGLAGFSFECSRYDKRASEMHAWSMSTRHPGIDIVRIPFDAKTVGSDGMKGVNWLTLLGADLIAELGGARQLRNRLSADIDLVACKHGMIVKAGSVPAIGDVNRGEPLALYREVYALLEPWISVGAKRSMALRLINDPIDRTVKWHMRFGE
jgi:hypothetical protein